MSTTPFVATTERELERPAGFLESGSWEAIARVGSGPLRAEPETPVTVDLILLAGFDIHDLSALLDTFHMANCITQRRVFSWRIIGTGQLQIRASSGLSISADYRLGDILRSENVFLFSGFDHTDQNAGQLEAWLRRQLWHGAHLGAIGGSSILLADMGILCNRGCAAHWAHIDGYRRRHHHINFQDQIYHVDRGIITCSGGCGTTDLALACVRQLCGNQVSTDIADRMNRYRVRDEHDTQGMFCTARHSITNNAAQIMRQHTESPLKGHEIAARLGISLRRLQRAFQRHEKVTPSQFYIRERLLKARTLLRHSSLTVAAVARNAGFVSASDFARNYAQLFGCPPSQDR